MKTFKHHNARSLRAATALLARYQGKAKIIAGGTDLIGILKDRCGPGYPEALINIKSVKGLDYIKSGKQELRIGALAGLADIVKSPEIRKRYPMLSQAAQSVAGPILRNIATIGGNLAQEVRCWYYRYPQQIGGPISCLRNGGGTCGALLGDNRYHSIFGAAPAIEGSCAGNCPARIDIPAYFCLLRQGKLRDAARLLIERNPIPAITGRVCPAYCEPHCNRAEYDDAVAIREIERGIGDYILDHAAEFFTPPAAESGKRIAIVGSGPAGLAAAYYLRKSGHRVTVYEKLPEPGGMLLYSIPQYRLPKEVVRKVIQALEATGVVFETGVEVGHQLAASIQASFDAVFDACGTWRNLKLDVPGENAEGVYYALDYLKRINSGHKLPLGEKVIVIGGGSVAVDAARTARRTGSEEVHLVCLETRDLTSRDRMPALDKEILQAEEEGIIIHPCLGIARIIEINGRAVGVETRKCVSVREPGGRFNPQYDLDSPSLNLQGNSIIIAIGLTADPSPFAPAGNVFAGGDMSEGPSTAVRAVASAQKAAREIEALLGAPRTEAARPEAEPEFFEMHFDDLPRVLIEETPAAQRVRGIDIEDMSGLDLQAVEKEAHRCIHCGCLAVGPSDLATALISLDAAIVTTKRSIPAQAFFVATDVSSTVLEPDELIREIRIPRPPKGARQNYAKFTLRKPIDFALVSVASMIIVENGVCSDARITLGAVAPSPVRAKAAEAALRGAPVDDSRAAQAARLAVADARPLAMNAYKAEIARALVKRSVLGVSC